jgi:hypothetical protein
LARLFGGTDGPLLPYDSLVRQKLEDSVTYAAGAVSLPDLQQIDNVVKESPVKFVKEIELEHPTSQLWATTQRGCYEIIAISKHQ